MDPVLQQALTALAGLILAALFRYVPKLNTWFAAQADEIKQLTMLGLIALSAVVVYFGSCAGVSLPGVTAVACSPDGAKSLFVTVMWLLLGNQAGAGILPKPKDAKVAEKLGDLKREPEEKKLVADKVEEQRVEAEKK